MMTSNFNQLNFDNPFFISEDEYITLTGFNKTQFQEITDSLLSLKNSVVRSVRTSICSISHKITNRVIQ